MNVSLREIDQCEILTLQDNYVDLLAADNTATVRRALPLRGCELRGSVLAEHGFSALLTLFADGSPRQALFDFGFSEHGTSFNADALDVELGGVEALVLSHGHIDHFGGLRKLVERIGRRGIDLVLHPAAFRHPRYLQLTEQVRVNLPRLSRAMLREMGVTPVERKRPHLMLDGSLLFLGEIPRVSGFEKGMPNAYYEEHGEPRHDDVEDDSAIVANVRGKGLVILSGCAHSGIVNTVQYARRVTGVDKVFVVMGGFHLTGPAYAGIIEATTEALRKFAPRHVVPTHCTGRNAALHIERAMHDEFVLNMVGTTLTFAA